MRAALHVLGTLVLLPYIALALAFVFLGRAIASGSLLGFLDALLSEIAWLVPWGLLGFVCAVILLAALGLHARSRRIGGLCLCLVAAACLVVILGLHSSAIEIGQVFFLLPCVAVSIFGAWLALAERGARHTDENAA